MVTNDCKMMVKKLHTVSNLSYETAAWQAQKLVCGVDEVGRGCLAGPVVAAAVIFPAKEVIDNVRDSKTVSPQELPILAEKIMQKSWYAIGISNPYLIDNCNIDMATKRAMIRSVNNVLAICPIMPSRLLIDAVKLAPYLSAKIECVSQPKGETWSYSIAAASIVAKVFRDRLMAHYEQHFSGLYFAKHKGYGTKEHYDALLNFGATILHRQSFLKNFNQNVRLAKQEQIKLF